NRNSVKQFVGDDNERDIRKVRYLCDPTGLCPASGRKFLLLYLAQSGACLHHRDPGDGREPWVEAIDGAQHVDHQRAAARTDLNKCEGDGLSSGNPGRIGPNPEQFAEHLTDLRRSNKIARRTERLARGVVTILRVKQAYRHKFSDGDRPRGGDQLLEPGLQCRHLIWTVRLSLPRCREAPSVWRGSFPW